jgi:hypothetical protein
MLDAIALLFSVLSLAGSGYAIYRNRLPGPQGLKGDVGDTGARGEKGEPGILGQTRTIEPARQVAKAHEPLQKFLSKADRREQIAAQADDPDFEVELEKVRKRLRDGSGLIAPDTEAQTEQQPDWRKRNAR